MIDLQHNRRLAVREHGFTLVEVIIAALLLTAIISGLALAVSSGMRAQSAAKSSKSLHAVSLRVFEHVRSERDWMESCTTVGTACTLPVPGHLLEDKSAGPSCTGGGTYQHKLVKAAATPVDSKVDGTGAADRDQKIPDYFNVRIEVAAADCAKARLGGPAPAVFESAVDRSGKIPEGSLEIEVCAAVNQLDERMSIAGCKGAGGDATEMLKCPPSSSLWNGTPAASCGAVHALTAGRAHNVDFSPSVSMVRATSTFQVVNAGGVVVATSSNALPGSPAGVYRFKGVPAGTYFIRNINPGGAAAGMKVWDSKMIPASDASGSQLGLIVQPDVQSRGLIMFAPKDTGKLNLKFKRQVTIHNVYRVNTGLQMAEAKVSTEDFQGNSGAIEAALRANDTRINGWEKMCDNATFAYSAYGEAVDCSFESYNHKVGQNCWKVGVKPSVIGATTGMSFASETYSQICSYYDFNVGFEYETTQLAGKPIRDGAAMGAAYGSLAMPTYRHVVRPGSVTVPACIGIAAGGLGSRQLAPTGGCVATRTTPNTASFGPFTPGLYAGITSRSAPVSVGWGGTFLNDGGGAWTHARNEAINPIPAGLKKGIWVRPNGTIRDANGGTYAPGQTVNVVGKGECYWTYLGGSEKMGSCNPCNPYIPGLGNASTCYILRKVTWKRSVFCETTGPAPGDFPCNKDNAGTSTQVKFCSGPPAKGNHTKTAPNCSASSGSGPGVGGGAGGSGGSIPSANVPSSWGPMSVGATAVGD